MKQRSEEPSPSSDGIFARALFGGRFAWLKRIARWFNLTMVQQALWPLVLVLTAAPSVNVDETSTGWFFVRALGPLAAALLALFFVQRDSPSLLSRNQLIPPTDSFIVQQARFFVFGVTLTLVVVRLLTGSVPEASRTIVFGLVSVAAYHLIHFGVVPISFPGAPRPWLMPVVLFGLSWGMHDVLLVSTDNGTWYLALLAGCVLGWLVGGGSVLIRRWPGGALTAAAAHFSIVYLVFGFL